MKVYWASSAEQDRADIVEYIAQDNPSAAIQMDELFGKAARLLSENPTIGRMGQVSGTREIFPHANYRLIYEVVSDQVWILALVHTARMWPRIKVR